MLIRALTVLAIVALATANADLVPVDSLPKQLPIDVVPLGLDERTTPADNTLNDARVALGRRLFFDPILSGDKSLACASCHQPGHGFASVDAVPRGVGNKAGTRRAPTILNRAFGTSFFWDGRNLSLEEQALEPIKNPVELGSNVEEAVNRLKADGKYREQFAAAFTDGVTDKNLGRALASFERVLLRGDSGVDKFRHNGDRDAMTAPERHGLWLYESKGQCWRCHSGKNFTDEKFHNTGVNWGKQPQDLGRFGVTKRDADRGKFKTPTLRGVKLRPPYMHDGSIKTLEDVVEFYNRGGQANPHLDKELRSLELNAEEKAALVAFLMSL